MRFKKSPPKCKKCYTRLSEENRAIGFCRECAESEIPRIKRRMILSAVIGAFLIALVFGVLYYFRATAYVSDTRGYEGDIFVPTFFGHLAFNAHAFYSMTNLSSPAQILLAAICFLLPFGSYVRLEFDTHRHKAESDLYASEPLTGNAVSKSGYSRMDDVGFFIVSLALSAISGPVFFVYRLYKYNQLSAYMKNKSPAE